MLVLKAKARKKRKISQTDAQKKHIPENNAKWKNMKIEYYN